MIAAPSEFGTTACKRPEGGYTQLSEGNESSTPNAEAKMKRRFALPVTIAMTVEAVLLLCFNQPAPAMATAPKPPEPPTEWRPIDLPPVVVVPSTEESGGKHSSLPARPALPEPPVILDTNKVSIDTPPVTIDSSKPTYHIESGPPVEFGEGGIDGNGVYGSSLLDSAPRARVQPPPRYPDEAKRSGVEGEVVVEFSVNESGRVFNPRVVSSTSPMFEEPTLAAVSKWRFEPGRRDGKIVSFRMMVPVEFHLGGD